MLWCWSCSAAMSVKAPRSDAAAKMVAECWVAGAVVVEQLVSSRQVMVSRVRLRWRVGVFMGLFLATRR